MCNQFIERAERNESKQEAAVFASSYCLSMCQSPLPHAFLTFQVAIHSYLDFLNDKTELGLISITTKHLQVVKGCVELNVWFPGLKQSSSPSHQHRLSPLHVGVTRSFSLPLLTQPVLSAVSKSEQAANAQRKEQNILPQIMLFILSID